MRLGCAQSGGGVVWMVNDGEVTFKGGTITNTKAVRTGNDARSHAGTGCRMLRGLRRAVCRARCMGMRDSMARSSCAVSAAGRMPHLGMGPALCGTSPVGAHSAASHWNVLGCGRHAAWRIVLWPGMGPDAVVESQQGPKPVCEVRDSPLSVGSWISLGSPSVSLEALKGF